MFNKVIFVYKNLFYGSVYRHYDKDLDSLKVSDLMSFVGFSVMFSTGVTASSAVEVPA